MFRRSGALSAVAAVLSTVLLLGPLWLGPPAQASKGGPDSYGYVWVDSRSPSPVVTYSWVDIAKTGTRLSLTDNGCTFEMGLGFQFRYYGTIIDTVYVCANGFLTFSIPTSFYPDPPIPSPLEPNDRVVGLGYPADLNPEYGAGGVFVQSTTSSTPHRFVVEWSQVYEYGTKQPQTFQIILEQNDTSTDGRILLEYSQITLATALVGIENRTGSSGLAYPGALGNSLAVAFLPPSDAALPPDTLSVTAAVLAPSNVSQGNASVPMLRLTLATPTNVVRVASVRVALSGLGSDRRDVSLTAVWLDNGNGTFEAGADLLLATSTFAGTPPIAQFSLHPSLNVTAGTPQQVFVTYNIAPSAGTGDWVGARLSDASFLTLEYPDIVGGGGFPIDSYSAGNRTQIRASVDTLSARKLAGPPSRNASQWETDIPVLALELNADRNLVDLAGMQVALGGNATSADLWAVKAVRDRDRSGAYTPGVDDVLAIAAPVPSPPRALLPFSFTVAAGSPERILVLLDVSPDAVPGHVLNITVNATGILLPAGSADRINGTGFPVAAGNVSIVPGLRPAIAATWTDTPPKPDGLWSAGEYVLGPKSTVAVNRPAGNRVPGYVTVESNATTLFVAVDAINDTAVDPKDGVAIGFDTDANGIPTPGADDVFVANVTGGGHYRYNALASNWTLWSPCAAYSGNPSVPACASGFGASDFSGAPHRFYEFAIPVGLLGIPSPVPANTSVRFALAPPPYYGLSDGGNRSTWPLVFGLAPPLAYFGNLNLGLAPPPNRPPTLTWTGQPGYQTDGLEPEAGIVGGRFRWAISYTDLDGDPPALGQPRLHLLLNGFETATSPLAMSEQNASDTVYTDGKVYVLTLEIMDCSGNYTYYFTARDARGGVANATPMRSGPKVTCPDLPPTLGVAPVFPSTGVPGTSFLYRVAYSDPEGSPPLFVNVTVRRDGVPVASQGLVFSAWVGFGGNFSEGAWFAGSINLTGVSSNYTYSFAASDGNTTVETNPVPGPQVIPPPPDLLTVTPQDLAPLIIDEGDRLVPFLRLTLLATGGPVNVSAIRIDRTGSAGDTEVQTLLLCDDRDGSGSLTSGDVILGEVQSPQRSTTFPMGLRVTTVASVNLLILANFTRPGTPDATVGFGLSNASAISVGAGDRVQPFSPILSTRVLVNVAPRVLDLTVNGDPAGSDPIRHVLGGTPVLAWRYADPNAADVFQVAYNVSVWNAAPAGLAWYRNESTANASAVYGGPALVAGRSYLLRVSVYDGRLWSRVVEAGFRRNTPPSAPDLLSPQDLATAMATPVGLTWRAVVDPEGDNITYTWWMSDSPGFAGARQGSTRATTASVSGLAPGTMYFWEVGASDGYEYAGNATVWRFTTAVPSPPKGQILGRVTDGTSPLPGARVELLNGALLVRETTTPANGSFGFQGLDLGNFTVRVSAAGFEVASLAAEPRENATTVQLGDIVLVPIPPGDGGRPSPDWLSIGLATIAVAVASVIVVVLLWRRRSSRARPGLDGAAGVGEVPLDSPPAEEEAMYVCPICGRDVAERATECECGAVFQT